jgi:formate hydrogenlyase transcriptional activator
MHADDVSRDKGLKQRRYETLLQITDVMSHQGSLTVLLPELAQCLRRVVGLDVINFALCDPPREVMQMHLWQGADKATVYREVPAADCASGWAWQNQQPLVFPTVEHGMRFARTYEWLEEHKVRSYCVLPMSTPQRRLGAVGFGSRTANAYSKDDLEFLKRVAELAALAVHNAITAHALAEEKQRLQALVEVSSALVSNLELESLFPLISAHLGRAVPHDFAGLALYDPEKGGMRAHVLASPQDAQIIAPGETIPLEQSPAGRAFTAGQTQVFCREDLATMNSGFSNRFLQAGIQSLCCVPLLTPKGVMGTLNIGRREESGFSPADESLLGEIAKQVAVALENARAYAEIEQLKDRLAKEKTYLEEEIRTELNFEEIIGESPALKRALAQAKTVASSDATVLILGETGTGKELIARAIHKMSHRKNSSFIKLNCAAIPTGLLESELFGHEKGAFTGAISQKIGRMELADRGTMFLDEVGDIPLELQPKLLRVLQDQEFERLGSSRTLKVDVRLLAATNRDLAKLVSAREFRSDLFYRLNVFPISVPPLRERRQDIPLLVRYFVQRLAHRMDRHIDTIPTDTMNALMGWDWPGNIRELENFIERSVILTTGSVLRAPLAELRAAPGDPGAGRRDLTLETAEREHILRILRESGGVISGPRGAASRLGLKRTTLQSKMLKLRITRQDYQN